MTYKQLQKNRGPASYRRYQLSCSGPAPYEAKGFRSGFVLLFAVTLAAILLSVALGVVNIAFREVKFGTSARDSNEAFFAADTGLEQAFLNDKNGNYTLQEGETSNLWNITVFGLGSTGASCATVTIAKDYIPELRTVIISKGYNVDCSSNNPNAVEREIKVIY